jgi:hypothetical protein
LAAKVEALDLRTDKSSEASVIGRITWSDLCWGLSPKSVADSGVEVITKHSARDGDDGFPYRDWTAPYRTPEGSRWSLQRTRNLRSAAWPPNLRWLFDFLAEGTEERDGGRPECGDELCVTQAREPGMGPIRGHWTGPRAERSWHQGEGWQESDPLGQLDADYDAPEA